MEFKKINLMGIVLIFLKNTEAEAMQAYVLPAEMAFAILNMKVIATVRKIASNLREIVRICRRNKNHDNFCGSSSEPKNLISSFSLPL